MPAKCLLPADRIVTLASSYFSLHVVPRARRSLSIKRWDGLERAGACALGVKPAFSTFLFERKVHKRPQKKKKGGNKPERWGV